ncbi:MAG: CoA transferase, partial [Actinomycetota bacterium]
SIVSGHPAERGTFDYFVAAMQKPEMMKDPRFADVASRVKNFDELMRAIKEWAATIDTADELERRLAENKLATGKLRSVAEVAQTKWAKQRNAFVEVDDRGEGRVKLPNAPWIFASSDTSTRGVVKYRGEDNAEVFGELLGLTAEQIADLQRRKILLQRLGKK